MNARTTPSLRIARLIITNFRTFRGPTDIVLSSGDAADAMPVFHGNNGAGKSNALAAVDLFFRVASCWLNSGATASQPPAEIKRSWGWLERGSGLSLNHRSWPPGSRDAQRIEVHFDDADLPALRATLTPSGNEVIVGLERAMSGTASHWEAPQALDKTIPPWQRLDETMGRMQRFGGIPGLTNALEAPLGPGSRPFFLLDARRRDFRSIGDGPPLSGAPETPLSPTLADRLLSARHLARAGRDRALAILRGPHPALQDALGSRALRAPGPSHWR